MDLRLLDKQLDSSRRVWKMNETHAYEGTF